MIPFTAFSSLENLILRSNPLTSLHSETAFTTLSMLDISSTALADLAELNHLPETLPALTSLLTSGTPIWSLTASNLHTIARISSLTSLNYSRITPQERTNAELYYLSNIASTLSLRPIEEEQLTLQDHPRYRDLCKLHGEPTIERKNLGNASKEKIAPGSLAARLTKLTFLLSKEISNGSDRSRSITKDFPRSIGIYALKGLMGRLLNLNPMNLKLVWETKEWDPVAAQSDGWSISEDSDDGVDDDYTKRLPKYKTPEIEIEGNYQEKDPARWMRREIELVDGTKDLGFWVDGSEATIRIELR